MTTEKGETLAGLNQTLTSVDNELLRRKVDRVSDELDDTVDQVNKLADDGVINLEYGQEADAPEADDADDPDNSTDDDPEPEGTTDSDDSDD